jgi:hypothetical protein
VSRRTKIILAVVALVVVVGIAASVALRGRDRSADRDGDGYRQVLAVTVSASGKVSQACADIFRQPRALWRRSTSTRSTVTAGLRPPRWTRHNSRFRSRRPRPG